MLRYENSYENKSQLEFYGQRRDTKMPITTQMQDPIYDTRKLNPFITNENIKSPNLSAANLNLQQMQIGNVTYVYDKPNQKQHDNIQNSFTSPYSSSKDNILKAAQKYEDYNSRSTTMVQQQHNERQQLYNMQHLVPMQNYTDGAQANFISSERRTPDTYGRSRNDRPISTFADYEDIYHTGQKINNQTDSSGYRRPTSPPNYNKHSMLKMMPGRYTQHLNVQV